MMLTGIRQFTVSLCHHLFKACRSWLRMSLPSLGSWRSYSSAQSAKQPASLPCIQRE